MATINHLYLLTLFTLAISAHSRLILDQKDHDAIIAIFKDLGHAASDTNNLCNTPEVFCNRRISNKSSVLRVTRVVFNSRRLRGSISEMTQLQSTVSGLPKRYVFAETNSGASNASSNDLQAPAPAPDTAPLQKPKGNDKKKKVIFLILGFLPGIVAGVICGTVFLVLFKLVVDMIKGKSNEHGATIFSQQIKAEELAFLEKEDGVALLQFIGEGGCGKVYKTDLPESKVKTIAIKKIDQLSNDALMNKKMTQIKSEIQTVGEIRHRNLLPLLAHVSRPNCHYLVYEFMQNGSLQDILEQVKEGERELDWLARHKIALGVASGLEYIHLNHIPRIVHGDLKPANVLLDDDMEARIADFGLAKSIPDADTHMTLSNVYGSFGYFAPEYTKTLKFTDKCDIYSFGVLLAVLVMGKFPGETFFQRTNEVDLVIWMRNVMIGEDPKQAIDPNMLGNGYEEQMLLVLKIACFCTLDNPQERPNSKDARLMLAQIIHQPEREQVGGLEGARPPPTAADLPLIRCLPETFASWQHNFYPFRDRAF